VTKEKIERKENNKNETNKSRHRNKSLPVSINPKCTSKYDATIYQTCQKLAKVNDVYKFQQKLQEEYHPLTDWTGRRQIKIGSNLRLDN
jgi:hypothetical protein